MGMYTEHVLPRIVDVACNLKQVHPQRRRACDGLAGEVVEIGFGSGLNVPFYPPGVTQVTAVEPSDVGWKLAGKRLRDTSIPIRRAGLAAEALPFPDDSFDAALSTWTRTCAAGSTVSSRSRSASSAAATSRAPSWSWSRERASRSRNSTSTTRRARRSRLAPT